jgi:hypothetical protein
MSNPQAPHRRRLGAREGTVAGSGGDDAGTSVLCAAAGASTGFVSIPLEAVGGGGISASSAFIIDVCRMAFETVAR